MGQLTGLADSNLVQAHPGSSMAGVSKSVSKIGSRPSHAEPLRPELKIFNAGGYEGWCWSPRGAMPGVMRYPDGGGLTAAERARREQVPLAAAGQIEAKKRTVNIPSHILPVLAAHMKTWAGPDRVFVGRDGRPMRGDAVRQAFNCARLKQACPGSGFMI
jgi:hypothetical protein